MPVKKRISVSLTPLQDQRAKELADLHQISKSKVIREALDFYWRFGPDRIEGKYQQPKDKKARIKIGKADIWPTIVKIMSGK